MGRLFDELRRRNVIRTGIAYVVAAWVLLQVVDLIAPVLGWPDSVTRITLYGLLVGFPIALLLSWYFQITADGVRLDDDSAQTEPTSPVVDQRLNLIVIALLCAAVILFAYDKWWPDEATDPSVAVLPFVNMSGLEENEYFADGLTETLLHDLAQNPNLRVAARTSSFAFKNTNKDVRDIAADLGVANILEGSVQRAGDNLRITAQLIRASDGSHLWSAKFDRKLDDIFSIQDEIAASVGAELTASLLGIAETILPVGISTSDTQAYDYYLQALAEDRIHSFAALQNAAELLKSALVRDPKFTEAKALLGKIYVDLADTGAMDVEVGLAQARALYKQVLLDQPKHIGARAFLIIEAAIQAVGQGDLAARTAAVQPLLDLIAEAPNNFEARMAIAMVLNSNSMFHESIEQYKKAIELDPLNPEPPHLLGYVYSRMRQWDAAREQIARSLELEPNQPNTVAQLAELSEATGDAAGYIRAMQDAMEIDPLDYELPYAIARLCYELGLIDEGDEFGTRVFAIAPDSPAAQSLKIIRSIQADSEEVSLEVARQLIRDDADDRRQAWIRAFRHLMLTAVWRGRTREEMEFVEEYVPDFSNWDEYPKDWKIGLGRAHTLEIWRDLDTNKGMQDRINLIEQGFATLNLPMSRVPHVHIDVLLLRGDLEGAINSALDNLFAHSILEHLRIKGRFVTPLYSEFVADPRIIAALANWDDEYAQAQEDARAFFAAQQEALKN
jgi:TolB-like protein/tetratricopeptide (TPR) repeat protein